MGDIVEIWGRLRVRVRMRVRVRAG